MLYGFRATGFGPRVHGSQDLGVWVSGFTPLVEVKEGCFGFPVAGLSFTVHGP